MIKAALLLLVLVAGCSREQPAAVPPPAVPPVAGEEIPGLPIELTVRQRSTTAVPGSDDALRLTIDDVTNDQVMTSLATKDGVSLLAPVSLETDKSATFQFQGRAYSLTLKILNNVLIGQDFATFVLAAAPVRTALTEAAKIERLLRIVAESGSVFLRNGGEHTPKAAADHLRSKWAAKADEITTAARFINSVASKSSLSGEAYQIRFADGRLVPLADWLREHLADIEQEK